MPGTNACQTSASLSWTGIWVSAPALSNRHNVTLSASAEAIAKFVPVTPSCSPGVAPSGNGVPGSAPVAPESGAPGRRGRCQPRWCVCWSLLCLLAQLRLVAQVTRDVSDGLDRPVAAQDHVGNQAGPPGLV